MFDEWWTDKTGTKDTELTIHCTYVVPVIEPAAEIALEVYPNPATEAIVVDWVNGSPALVILYDQIGREVFRQSDVAPGTALEPHLPGRVYELVLVIDSKHYVQQVIFE